MNIARTKVIDLLNSKNCKPFGSVSDKDVWVAPDGTIIRLPQGSHIDMEIVSIVIEQLNMGAWEFDYWLGQIGFNLNGKWN